jgi:hypothetical protein
MEDADGTPKPGLPASPEPSAMTRADRDEARSNRANTDSRSQQGTIDPNQSITSHAHQLTR